MDAQTVLVWSNQATSPRSPTGQARLASSCHGCWRQHLGGHSRWTSRFAGRAGVHGPRTWFPEVAGGSEEAVEIPHAQRARPAASLPPLSLQVPGRGCGVPPGANLSLRPACSWSSVCLLTSQPSPTRRFLPHTLQLPLQSPRRKVLQPVDGLLLLLLLLLPLQPRRPQQGVARSLNTALPPRATGRHVEAAAHLFSGGFVTGPRDITLQSTWRILIK